jgi:hypothetical protein
LFPNDFTVLILTTVSLINEPINFSVSYVFDVSFFNKAILTAPATIINGLKPKTIKVSIQEFVNAKINEIVTVEKFMHITAHTPDIILFN